MAEGHHRGRRPPAREAGVPPAGTSVRRAQRAVYASMNDIVSAFVFVCIRSALCLFQFLSHPPLTRSMHKALLLIFLVWAGLLMSSLPLSGERHIFGWL